MPPVKKRLVPARFSPDEDEMLIEFVRTHTALYDVTDENYKDIDKKVLLWKEAGIIVNKTANECRKRWKSMRDNYTRDKKKEKDTGKKRAGYWKQLRFLDGDDEWNSLSEEPSTSARGEDASDHIMEESEAARQDNLVLQKYFKERKEDREQLKRCLEKLAVPQQSDTEIDLFFKAMAATVKKFRPDLVTRTKSSVFNVVTEMEMLNQKHSNKFTI